MIEPTSRDLSAFAFAWMNPPSGGYRRFLSSRSNTRQASRVVPFGLLNRRTPPSPPPLAFGVLVLTFCFVVGNRPANPPPPPSPPSPPDPQRQWRRERGLRHSETFRGMVGVVHLSAGVILLGKVALREVPISWDEVSVVVVYSSLGVRVRGIYPSVPLEMGSPAPWNRLFMFTQRWRVCSPG